METHSIAPLCFSSCVPSAHLHYAMKAHVTGRWFFVSYIHELILSLSFSLFSHLFYSLRDIYCAHRRSVHLSLSLSLSQPPNDSLSSWLIMHASALGERIYILVDIFCSTNFLRLSSARGPLYVSISLPL